MVRASEGRSSLTHSKNRPQLATVGHAVVERDRAPVVGVLVIDVQLQERNDLEEALADAELLVARGGALEQLLQQLLVDRQQHLDVREDEIEVLVRDERVLIGDLSKWMKIQLQCEPNRESRDSQQ